MTFLGIPQACEATAVILDSCARKLRAYAQAIVRPDLDELQIRNATLSVIMLTQTRLAEIEAALGQPQVKLARYWGRTITQPIQRSACHGH